MKGKSEKITKKRGLITANKKRLIIERTVPIKLTEPITAQSSKAD